jgi:signal transduction histidine kinase
MAHYSELAPGDYHFRLQAANANGQWEEAGAGVSFVLLPQFWQTVWFRALSGAGLLGGVAAAIRLVERRRYRARLRRMEQERAMEDERVRIARDLHDELGSSLTYISMSITDIGQSEETNVEQLKSRVAKISSFAVRTARALDEIVWAVNPRNDSLRSLAEYLTELARELFEHAEVRCRFQIADNLPDVPLPPAMRHNIFLTVREALTNVLKHSQAKEVVFSVNAMDERIVIGLQDDGAGFDPAVPLQGEHNGLSNMRQRIEAIGGQLQIETAPGQGTAIRLLLNHPPGRQAARKSPP